MRPAAKVGSKHACHGLGHTGGIVLDGARDVIVENANASRAGDRAMCAPICDVIVEGCATVFFRGMPAARSGDRTAHGGVIGSGAAMVFIGDETAAPAAATRIANNLAELAVLEEKRQRLVEMKIYLEYLLGYEASPAKNLFNSTFKAPKPEGLPRDHAIDKIEEADQRDKNLEELAQVSDGVQAHNERMKQLDQDNESLRNGEDPAARPRDPRLDKEYPDWPAAHDYARSKRAD